MVGKERQGQKKSDRSEKLLKINNANELSLKESSKFLCSSCGNRYRNQKQLSLHEKTHACKLHVCPICNEQYPRKTVLKKHIKTHSGNEDHYSCETCGKKFKQYVRFVSHKISHVEKNNTEMHGVDIYVNSDNSKTEFQCCVCNKTFKCKEYLEQHKKIHTSEKMYKCDLCDMAFTCANYLTGHRNKVHNVKNVLFKCNICDKIYKNKSGLKLHQYSHRDDRPFVCKVCGAGYKYALSLKEHTRRHKNEKPYVCEKCLVGFTTCTGLKEHRRWHSGIREFQCETCGKSYIRKCQLKSHERSHTGEMPFLCKQCGKCFRYFIRLEDTRANSHWCEAICL